MYQTYWRNKYGQLVWWPCDAAGERITSQAEINRLMDECRREIELIVRNMGHSHDEL